MILDTGTCKIVCASVERRMATDPEKFQVGFTAVPDDNDIEAIFTWRGHGRSFVGFLSGNVRQLHLDSNFLLQFLPCLFHKLAH